VLKIYALIIDVQFTHFQRSFMAINVEELLEFRANIYEQDSRGKRQKVKGERSKFKRAVTLSRTCKRLLSELPEKDPKEAKDD
jgi:hypothetical protein